MKNTINKIGNFINNFLNADRGTQIRTITLIVSLISLFAKTVFGKEISLNPDIILEYVIDALVAITSIVGLWKNNDYTPVARKYTEAMRIEKATIFEEVEGDDDPETEDEIIGVGFGIQDEDIEVNEIDAEG